MGTARLLARALGYWAAHRKSAVLLFLMLVVEQLFLTFFAYSMKLILDHALSGRDATRLFEILGALLVGFVLAAAAELYASYLIASVSASILNGLRLRMFERMQSLSMSFYSGVESGDILSRFTSDISEIDKGILSRGTDGVSCVLGAIVNVPLMLTIDWRLSAIALFGIPLIIVGTRLFSARAVDDKKQLRSVEGQLGSTVQENIRVQQVIKVFGLRDLTVGRFADQLASHGKRYVRTYFGMDLVAATSSLAVRFTQIIVIACGAYFAFRGTLSPGSLVAFIGLHGALSNEVFDFTKKVMPSFLSAAPSMQRIEQMLAEPIEVTDSGTKTLPKVAREIRFDGVTFGYGDKKILDGVSFSVPCGTSTALVGPSGSGKSTVLKLLMRLHDPQAGHVLLDDVDAKEVTQESLHRNMAAVFQDTFLFNDTIRENIRMGRRDATDAEIEQAARSAEIHELVESLPEKYETRVGELGGRLSGGQRQRIAIARAILRDPRILVLDEATSALDPATEVAVNETIARIGEERTVLSVTHRLASAQHADRVLVFDRGKLAESGTHDELLGLHGIYHALWTKQTSVEVAPDGRGATIKPARLKAVPLFAELDDAQLASIASALVFERHEANTIIVKKGDPGDKFYIVARGKVEAFDPDASKSLSVMSDGDFFGEIALQQDVPRSASVRTLVPCSFLTLGASQFRDLMSKTPGMRALVETAIRKRLANSAAL